MKLVLHAEEEMDLLSAALLAALLVEAGNPPKTYEETVEVRAPALTAIERQVIVRARDGTVLTAVRPEWFSAQSTGSGAGVVDVTARPFDGPAALTVVVDTSRSMIQLGARQRSERLLAELLLALPSGDHVRLITFNDHLTFTDWLEADRLRAAVLARHLRRLAGLQPARRPACLRGEPAKALEDGPATWEWASACTIEEQREIEREAVGRFVAAMHALTGGSVSRPAMREAITGFLPTPGLPFVPGYESTLGLVVISDSGFDGTLDDWDEAVLRTLLVQEFFFTAPGTVFGLDGGRIHESIPLSGMAPADAAARVIRAVHAVHVLTVSSESPAIARPMRSS